MPLRAMNPLNHWRAAARLSLILAITLAGCRSATRNTTPSVATTTQAPATAPQPASTPSPSPAAPTPSATRTPPSQPLAAILPVAETLPAPAYTLQLTAGWERAAAQPAPGQATSQDTDYAFALRLPAAAGDPPAAIATGLIVAAHGLDLPAFVQAASSELLQYEGVAVLSTGVDGLLGSDGRPVGVLAYSVPRHEQLGERPAGRQYALAAPTDDAMIVVTCLAASTTDPATACDAVARAVLFD